MQARFHKPKGCNRICLSPIGQLRDQDQVGVYLLKEALQSKIHKGIFNLNGLGPNALLDRIQRSRYERGAFLLEADLKEFFLSIDWFRCRSLLRRAGIPGFLYSGFGLGFLQSNAQKPHRGLPQGFAVSPWIAGLYITPILKRMDARYQVFCYVDNLYVLARTRKNAQEALKFLRRCLEEHSYGGKKRDCSVFPAQASGARLLKLHDSGPKAYRIIPASADAEVLGFTLGAVVRQ